MQRMFVYSIRDRLAKKCYPLFEAVNDEVALRSFRQIVVDQRIAEDSELWRVAEFDRDTGVVLAGDGYPTNILESGGDTGLPTVAPVKSEVFNG